MCKVESLSFDQKFSIILHAKPDAIVGTNGRWFLREQALGRYRASVAGFDDTDREIIKDQRLEITLTVPKKK